jgi:hypothetical protein
MEVIERRPLSVTDLENKRLMEGDSHDERALKDYKEIRITQMIRHKLQQDSCFAFLSNKQGVPQSNSLTNETAINIY